MFLTLFSNYLVLLANLIGVALVMPQIRLLMMPEDWGDYSRTLTILSTVMIIETGLSQLLPKFVSAAVKSGQSSYAVFIVCRRMALRVPLLVVSIVGVTIFLALHLPMVSFFQSLSALRLEMLIFVAIGLIVGLQKSVVAGVLVGLGRQISGNNIQSLMIVCRYIGSWIILAFVATTLQALLIVQVVVLICEFLVLNFVLRRCFDEKGVRTDEVHQWSAPVSEIAVLTGTVAVGAFVSLFDKWSFMLTSSTAAYGSYALVSTAASFLNQLQYPILRSYYPKLLSAGNEEQRDYIGGKLIRTVFCVIGGMVMLVFLFGEQLLLIWSHDADFSKSYYVIFCYLSLAILINSLYNAWFYQPLLVEGDSSSLVKIQILSLCVTGVGFVYSLFYEGFAGWPVAVLASSAQFTFGWVFVKLRAKVS